jgi:electron transfer flavoprotein beta subunit
MLAALLDWPYASVVNRIEVEGGKSLRIGREIEGGSQEISDIELPASSPSRPASTNLATSASAASARWPPSRSRCSTPERSGLSPDTVGAAGARVKRVDYFVPQTGAGAEMLTGSTEEVAGKLVDLLKAKGGIK